MNSVNFLIIKIIKWNAIVHELLWEIGIALKIEFGTSEIDLYIYSTTSYAIKVHPHNLIHFHSIDPRFQSFPFQEVSSAVEAVCLDNCNILAERPSISFFRHIQVGQL
jgi:hypothetical protein